jgi:hypothetical protein
MPNTLDITSIARNKIAAVIAALAARLLAEPEEPGAAAVKTDPTGPLLDAKQLAAKLNAPVSWVYEQSRLGNIPCTKLGRYSRYRLADVEAALKDRKP